MERALECRAIGGSWPFLGHGSDSKEAASEITSDLTAPFGYHCDTNGRKSNLVTK